MISWMKLYSASLDWKLKKNVRYAAVDGDEVYVVEVAADGVIRLAETWTLRGNYLLKDADTINIKGMVLPFSIFSAGLTFMEISKVNLEDNLESDAYCYGIIDRDTGKLRGVYPFYIGAFVKGLEDTFDFKTHKARLLYYDYRIANGYVHVVIIPGKFEDVLNKLNDEDGVGK